MNQLDFSYSDERFADIQLLRYRLNGFEKLSKNVYIQSIVATETMKISWLWKSI